MKKIIYIHQYFKTPKQGGAIRSYHIAKGMVDNGFHVDMITSRNNAIEHKKIDGINVHYLLVKYANEYSFFKRLISFTRFIISAIAKGNEIKNADFIYATSTPLTVGLIALWMKWKKKIPYIFEVRDLWPEAPIQLQVLKSAPLKAIARKIEKLIYKNAAEIIALSPGIKEGVTTVYPQAKIHMIPNMADVKFIQKKSSITHEKHDFTIGYFGSFGYANNINFILNIADACQKSNLDVQFKLAGEGAMKKSILSTIEERKLKNITILDYMNRDETRSALNTVDACITSFLNVRILETNSPNKFFDGLAAGKLSIVNTQGWLKNLVEENNCGFFIDPEKPDTFPGLIKPFLDDKKLLVSHQQNALNLAKEQFQKEDLVNKICSLVERV